MPTQAFEIADSQDTAYNGGAGGSRVKRTIRGTTMNAIIDGVADTLVAAGWTLEGGTKPRVEFLYPYGFPNALPAVPEPMSKPTSTGLSAGTVQGVRFLFYDPTRELPGTTTSTDVWVMMGASSAVSFANLITAIEGSTAWRVLETHVYLTGGGWYGTAFTLEHNVPGTQFNGPTAGGEGTAGGRPFWSTGSPVNGGGWVLRSTMASGEWLQCTVYALSTVTFSFTSSREGAEQIFNLGPAFVSTYELIANQFQFWLLAAAADANARDVFACQPYLEHGCEQAAFVTCSGAIRNSLMWQYTAYWGRESALTTGASGTLGVNVFVLRTASELITTQGQHIATSAWVGLPDGTTGPCAIVGKIWDAFVLSKSSTLDDDVFHRDMKFRCVARNGPFGSNVGSLWVAYE